MKVKVPYYGVWSPYLWKDDPDAGGWLMDSNGHHITSPSRVILAQHLIERPGAEVRKIEDLELEIELTDLAG